MTAQVAADLRAAAEVLRRDGWTQATHENSSGCRCVSGALAYVASDSVTSQPGRLEINAEYLRWAEAAARFRAIVEDDSLVHFNDAPGRTADEVIAALEAAAATVEAEQ